MYANGVLKTDVERFRKEGALAQAKLAPVREVTEANKLQAGEELFRMQCIACHSIDGPRRSRVMTERAKGWSEEALAAFIPQMHTIRPVMPPFAGTDEEVKALAAYLHKMVTERSSAE